MDSAKILALTGGVGGAKLALGLTDLLGEDQLEIVVNTADDFRHLGLNICPDIDTLLYTLSGKSNQQLGWGLAGESWAAMDALEQLGGETWFRLGDKDLATHLWRTQALGDGTCLAQVTDNLAKRMGVQHSIHPMSDDPVSTLVHSDEGDLPFQHYFVRRQCAPAVTGFSFRGLDRAVVNPAVSELIASQSLKGVVICPSNPFVSVDPILRLPGFYESLKASHIPVIAVSPIVAGMAIKGPAAKMMAELNMPVTALAVAEHYAEHYPGLLNHFVIDQSDGTLAPVINELGMIAATTATIMKTREDKRALAEFVLRLLEI